MNGPRAYLLARLFVAVRKRGRIINIAWASGR